MKTVHNRSGFNETDMKQENPRKYPNYRQRNKNYIKYTGNSSRGFNHNKHLGSFRPQNHMNFNRGRDKNVKYNGSKIPYLMHLKLSNTTPQSSKEAPPWSEEALELERKQQLSDTANKLLNKLKMWNSEGNEGKEHEVSFNERTSTPEVSSQTKKVKNKLIGESQNKGPGNASGTQAKKVHVANHETAKKNIIPPQKLQRKNKCQGMSQTKQKKIQQNIIGELMAMPKENLNKVLVNPKIHPKIERKMAQIVKENRLILAQKFRHLAESKINSQGQFQFQSNFINDVENLIDPDLAIDLCQLPPELIKQMGDIFQLDFDACLKSTEQQEEINSCNTTYEDNTNFSDSCMSIGAMENDNGSDFERVDVKQESQNMDVVENVEIDQQKIGKISVRNFANCYNENLSIDQPSAVESSVRDLPVEDRIFLNINESSCSGSGILGTSGKQCSSSFDSNKFPRVSPVRNHTITTKVHHSKETTTETAIKEEDCIVWQHPDESHVSENSFEVEERRFSESLGNDKPPETKSSEVQTDINLIELDHSSIFQTNVNEDADKQALLREVDLIDDLIHELNRRRFFLFLKIMNLNTCNFNNKLKNKLLQSITNCDTAIVNKIRYKNKRKHNGPDNVQPTNKKKRQCKSAKNIEKTPMVKREHEPDVVIVEPVINSGNVKEECI